MAEGSFDDIDGLGREIDRLWSKVAASSAPDYDFPQASSAPSPSDTSPSKLLAWEAVSMLKQRHTRESRSWAEMLETKDQALRALRARVAALEADNAVLRQRADDDGRRVLEETEQAHAQLEAAMSSFESERRQREHEAATLRALLEQTRQRLAAETGRWQALEREWEKKEQQYLIDFKELHALASRHQKEQAQSADEASRLAAGMKEAKNALEKTLSELLRERQSRAETEQERAKATAKVQEVEKHLTELSKLWEEERAQWRELWDRERSTWEAQRQEYSSWEARLRQEREAWHADLQAKEKDQLRFTDEMTRTLRETTELSENVKKTLAETRKPPLIVWTPRLKQALAAGLVVLLLAPLAWRRLGRVSFEESSSQIVAVSSPTSLAFDGTLVWAASWDGKLMGFDPRNFDIPVRTAAPADVAPYRPVALAFGAGNLWTLDAAQARLLRHKASDPSGVLASRPAPGPAPTTLAFDGQSVWSYDAANRTLYQHGADEGSTKSFGLEPDVVVTAMAWVESRLWVFDAKARQLVEYSFDDGLFKRERAHEFDHPVLALSAGAAVTDGRRRRQLWTLEGPSGARQSPAFVRYDY